MYVRYYTQQNLEFVFESTCCQINFEELDNIDLKTELN